METWLACGNIFNVRRYLIRNSRVDIILASTLGIHMMVADTTKDELKQYGTTVSSSTKSSASGKKQYDKPAKQADKKGDKKRPPDAKQHVCRVCGRSHPLTNNAKDCNLYDHVDSNKSNHDFHLSDKGKLWIKRYEDGIQKYPTVDPYRDLQGNTVTPPEKFIAALKLISPVKPRSRRRRSKSMVTPLPMQTLQP